MIALLAIVLCVVLILTLALCKAAARPMPAPKAPRMVLVVTPYHHYWRQADQ